jgi:hypothetical protein
MTILSTVSHRSDANILIELFPVRGLLIVSGSSISMRSDRYLQRGEVTGAWKTQITLSFTLAFTLAIRQVLEGEEVAHD